jgi:DNA-binding NarL/FixJ family response regulator
MLIRREAVGKRGQETRREAAAGTVAQAERAGMEKTITERVPAQRMPTARATVFLYADDPISQAGVASQLRPRPEVQLVDPAELDRADVAVVVTESVDESVLRVLRAVRRGNVPRTVLIAAALDDAAVVAAAEAGVSALLRRAEVTPDRLVSVILKARDGGAEMPADLLAGLLGQVGRLQRQVLTPRGLRFSGLSDREVEVLRLVADGLDTGEIAQRLAFSERTIKSVLHDVTTRLQLRNRAHAVAFAVREGFI